MNKRCLPLSIVFAALVYGATAPSIAFSSTKGDEALKAQAKISEADASKVALLNVPNGTIKSAELENEHGRLIWSFDITSPKTKGVTEVNVDAKTGKVIARQNESQAYERTEAAKESKDSAGK